MKRKSFAILFMGITALSCLRGKAPEKNLLPREASSLATDALEYLHPDTLRHPATDTLAHPDIRLAPSVDLSNFDCLRIEIANQSADSLPLDEFCLQVKEKEEWKTLFCDTLAATTIPPGHTRTLKIDLQVGRFSYSSRKLYRFVAYYRKNNTVYSVSQAYYSLTLFRKNGKTYMLPDTVIEDKGGTSSLGDKNVISR